MKLIKKSKSVFIAIGLIMLAAHVILTDKIASAAGPFDEAMLAIQKSDLPQGSKKALSAKANEAVNIGISPDDIAIIISRGLQRGFDNKTLGGLLDSVIKVKRRGLPTRQVLDRIQQGISKGIDPEKLLSSTNRLAERIIFAKVIVDKVIKSGVKADSGKEEAIQMVATAMDRSIHEGVITQTGNVVKKYNYPISMFSRAVDVITTLSENGLPERESAGLVHKAINKGYSERDLLMLEREAFNNLREGRRPEETVNKLDSMINRSGNMGSGSGFMGSGSGSVPGGGFGAGSGFSHGSGTSSGMRGR